MRSLPIKLCRAPPSTHRGRRSPATGGSRRRYCDRPPRWSAPRSTPHLDEFDHLHPGEYSAHRHSGTSSVTPPNGSTLVTRTIGPRGPFPLARHIPPPALFIYPASVSVSSLPFSPTGFGVRDLQPRSPETSLSSPDPAVVGRWRSRGALTPCPHARPGMRTPPGSALRTPASAASVRHHAEGGTGLAPQGRASSS